MFAFGHVSALQSLQPSSKSECVTLIVERFRYPHTSWILVKDKDVRTYFVRAFRLSCAAPYEPLLGPDQAEEAHIRNFVRYKFGPEMLLNCVGSRYLCVILNCQHCLKER